MLAEVNKHFLFICIKTIKTGKQWWLLDNDTINKRSLKSGKEKEMDTNNEEWLRAQHGFSVKLVLVAVTCAGVAERVVLMFNRFLWRIRKGGTSSSQLSLSAPLLSSTDWSSPFVAHRPDNEKSTWRYLY